MRPCPRVLALVLSAAACAPAHDGPTTPRVIDAAFGAVDVRATADALVLALAADDGVHVRRMRGSGSDLIVDGPDVAAGALLDADENGRLYVFPGESQSSAAVSSMPPEGDEGSVTVVDADGVATMMLRGGRGIWAFGIAPAGDALWVTACGPTGIFATDMTTTMTPPNTLWEQLPSALTDPYTFWSLGPPTCLGADALTADCGYDLVRTTPEGSVALGSTLADHGEGFTYAELARCGAGVCGVYPRAVRMWDGSGAEGDTITLADVGAEDAERFAAATGNDAGVYVLLAGGDTARVVFVPGS